MSHKRVAIVGAPGTGKSTLARNRDDWVTTSFFEANGWRASGIAALRHALTISPDAYVVEGVTAAHAVRAVPDAFDVVIVMQTPKHERYKRHIADGNDTVLDNVRGVKIVYELSCDV